MEKLKSFVITSLLGGLIVILPVTIIAFVFAWIFHFVTGLIQPLTNVLLAQSSIWEWAAHLLVIVIITFFCFLVGVFVRTRLGRVIHRQVENRLLKVAPGYNLIKETLRQLLGNQRSFFSRVAVVKIFGETMTTAFITDEHADGSYTIFIPQAPTPTSGSIFHLPGECVFPVDVSMDTAMKSIISCGGGSQPIMEKFQQLRRQGHKDKTG